MSRYVHRPSASPAAAAAWDTRRELMTNIRGIGGRAYPRVSGILRDRSWTFFEILLPFLTTAGFVFVYRALQAPPQYIGFVVLGGAMTAFWLNVMWMMAAQLHWEKDQGNLELYFTAPVSMMSILLGMAVGGMLMSCVRAAVVLGVGSFVFGVHFEVEQWGLLLAVFFLTLAALYGLGMLGALAIATIPLAVGLDAMRQLAFVDAPGLGGTPPPAIEALILVVMTFVFIGAARRLLATLERMARREGRLSLRWS